MGFEDPLNFDVEFIRKTKTLIEEYEDTFSFTLLINCLYSLIILTDDRLRERTINYFQTDIAQIPQLNAIIEQENFYFQPVTRRGNPQQHTLQHFIRRIRNSLAHPTLVPENATKANGKVIWKTIEFSSHNDFAPNTPLELRAKFTQGQLRIFATAVATAYQEGIANA